mgnify:FL=1
MLTKDDLAKIKVLLEPIEDKIDGLILETKAIHMIIERQDEDFRQRIERLEEDAGIISSS